MPKFDKQILRPGKYRPLTPQGRKDVEITPERIDGIVSTFVGMLGAGLRVPAPWRHDPEAVPFSIDTPGSAGVDGDGKKGSYLNAGFWEKLWKGKDGSLYGTLNVPREEDASRVGQTVIEVSPLIKPGLVDGKKRNWGENALAHIALVTNPVEPNQENFIPVPDEAIALSLSDLSEAAFGNIPVQTSSTSDPSIPNRQSKVPQADSDKSSPTGNVASLENVTATSPDIKQVLEVLKAIGLSLPEDTTPENIGERIIIGGKAIMGQEEDPNELPDGEQPKEQPIPLIMGTEEMDAKELKAIEDKHASELATLKRQSEVAFAFATNNAKDGYALRIGQLVANGQATEEYAKTHLTPLLETVEFSLADDGKPKSNNLDVVLGALEATPKKETNPFLDNTEGMTPAEMAAAFSLNTQPLPGEADDLEDEDVLNKLVDKLHNMGGVSTS